jgi:homoserine O-acetyltransferase/O-succinyltransferase
MPQPAAPPFERFVTRDFVLECGVVMPEMVLAYRARGRLDGPVVMTMTAFSHNPSDIGYLAEPDGPLDPALRGLLQVEQIGNGRSTSPSNAPAPFHGADFPPISVRDNIALQARLLDHLGIGRLHAAIGASMGGQQALQWAVSHPERVGKVIALVGNARTTLFAQIFLNAVKVALTSDPAFNGGRYAAPPLTGLSRMAEVWAGFATSPRYFSTGLHQGQPDMSGDTLDAFLEKWRPRYHEKDANDLLCQHGAWMRHDIGDTPGCGGDFVRAARRASMPILFAPGSTDVYFDPLDVADQAQHFPHARVEPIESLAGHAAAFGRERADRERVARLVRDFLDEDR